MSSQRLPRIAPAEYDEAQREAAAAFRSLRGTDPFGPFETLMHSPRLMMLAQAVGEYLRYHSGIGTTLSEFVILITARAWTQDFEWHVHAPIAERHGVAPEVIAAIRDGRRPEGMSEDETIVYDFTIELQRDRRVSDQSWARAETRFGRAAVVDLVGVSGYYTFLAMHLNAAQLELPAGSSKLPRFPE